MTRSLGSGGGGRVASHPTPPAVNRPKKCVRAASFRFHARQTDSRVSSSSSSILSSRLLFLLLASCPGGFFPLSSFRMSQDIRSPERLKKRPPLSRGAFKAVLYDIEWDGIAPNRRVLSV